MTQGPILQRLARFAGGALLAATGAVHLDLYLTGYRTIPTIGWLFLLQVVVAFLLAAALLVLGGRVLALGGALFSLATLGGYLLSIWVGLFGFKEVRTTAGLSAGVIEVAAFAVLGALAFVPVQPKGAKSTGGAGGLRKYERAGAGAVALVSLAAAAVLGSALATASGAPLVPTRARVELKAVRLHGSVVLANAAGYTLYLFAPDSSSASRCYGECAAYWPPVLGQPEAGPGVTGRLGTVRRSGGLEQASYDGHPLYTYVGDTAPGQANGNAIDLNGGYWYVVPVSASTSSSRGEGSS
ncbi:MAG: COG4315 family predicted lipoprotein [Acidimicrobiales bacterium]